MLQENQKLMIYKLWDKSHFRYCKKCEAVYVPHHLNEDEHRSIGPIEVVERCEECCLVCSNCGKLFEQVIGIRKPKFKGILTKSGELQVINNPRYDILEIHCGECGGKLEVEKYIKEVV